MSNETHVGIGRSLWSRAGSRLRRILSFVPPRPLLALFFSPGPIRLLALSGIALVLAIALATSLVTLNFAKRALANSQREMSNTALLVANHVDQLFEQIDLLQNGIIDFMRSKGIDTREEFEREMSTFEAHSMLQGRAATLSYLDGTSLYRTDGTLLNFSGSWPLPPNPGIADRDYFQTLMADRELTKLISAPLISRVTGTQTIILVRKFTSDRGELIGLILSGIKAAYFERFFDSILVGDCCSISLSRSDGVLLVRSPSIPGALGKIPPFAKQVAEARGARTVEIVGKQGLEPAIFRVVTSLWEKDHNISKLPSELDIPNRLLVANWSHSFSFLVIVGGDIDAILSDWYAQAKVSAAGTGLFLLVVAIVFALIVRKLFQQHTRSEQALLAEKERLDTAVDNMAQGLVLFDAAAKVVVCNERYKSMYGLSADATRPGQSLYDILCERKRLGSFEGEVDTYFRTLLRRAENGLAGETLNEMPDGRIIHVVFKPLANGGWVATHEDVTERRRAEERIAHLALHDSLTGLPNRTAFWNQLQRAVTWARAGEFIAVLYLDLDDFKSVNDSLGHPTGDELLKAVGCRLASVSRERDFVARLGGDEFAIIKGGLARSSDAVQLVTRVQGTLREPFDVGPHQILIDSSVGIAIYPGDGNEPDILLKNADLALYGAKAAGRGTYMFFEEEMDERFKARRALEIDLRQAIASDALELHYQPVVNCQTEAITGCEALLRWCHPRRGWISPAEFIPIAEETSLINAIGEWVLRKACRAAVSWPKAVRIAVNVSPMQFKNRALALIVVNALAEAGLSPSRLELEITEAVLMRDEDASSTLRELRALGVRIALDDFGTGYSSLSYLLKFPFDKIKIDRCFTREIASVDGSLPIVQAVIDIADSRGMTTTAEGVETMDQLIELRSLGCTEAQGFLFSQALSGGQIIELLSQDEPASLTG
jgi:diguanylate cyclase (GGDEF)-like protein/PAS domain S-box-containing protein